MKTDEIRSAWLQVDVRAYWIPGTGQAAGSHLDEVADREDGLPYLSGRHLKGLLRNALWRGEQWGHVRPGATASLLGQEHGDSALLRVDNARLPQTVRAFSLDNPSTMSVLFREVSATAVDDLGTAKRGSRRDFEVVVPLQMQAMISPLRNPGEWHDWFDILQRCLPLTRAVGKRRSRGFGRVGAMTLSWNEQRGAIN